MKNHAIIPIFIPHKGCPNDCIFCNQKKITARLKAVSASDVKDTIDTWLSTMDRSKIETVEVAFYGGSFTGLPIEEQSSYLEIAKAYKDAGLIDKIHMSTRPDYIDREILDNLKAYSVDVIELGVQSFDDNVLKLSNRGHNSEIVYSSSELIKEYGFSLGIQLMVGLPGDSMETCIYSAQETVKIAPDLARIYPTIVIDDTELYNQYARGEYEPLSREEAIARSKAIYQILFDAGITIMRVGLKSTDLINEGGNINGGTYHPAFRQLVEGALARDKVEALIEEAMQCTTCVPHSLEPETGLPTSNVCEHNTHHPKRLYPAGAESGRSNSKVSAQCTTCVPQQSEAGDGPGPTKVDIYSNSAWYSNLIGNCKCNKIYFAEKYPELNILYKVDNDLKDMEFKVVFKD